MAFDQGTTSSRAILFDGDGRLVQVAQREFPQHVRAHEQTGVDGQTLDCSIVEHDPEDIWKSQLECAREVLAKAGQTFQDVACIGITNQRETTILWDRSTGQAVAPALVWQSRVSAPICERLKAKGVEPEIRRRTGLVLDPYFSATKIVHLMETVPGLRQRCEDGDVIFGTVDSFLIWRLTGGRVHATDVTNASRTLLFDIHRMAWSDELCQLFDIPTNMLPEVRASSGDFGVTDSALFGGPIHIAGCAGDQLAASYGQGCIDSGQAKNTYGTGAFMIFSTGEQVVESVSGLLSTPGCGFADRPPTYCLEGAVFVAGALVGWLRDGLGIIEKSSDIESLARGVADTGGVMVVPALTGLGTPHWDPFARGLIIGLSRATTKAHVARAALEAIALSVADVVACMKKDSGMALTSLRVDGGASANDLLLQFQADILGITVERPAVLETTALGAALLAGLSTGFYADHNAVDEARRIDQQFEPNINDGERRRLRARWNDAVDRSKGWARIDDKA